ncbi:hypothetical protein AB0I81_38860 [Nonomuraea sp. NPDC050404]
MIKVLESYRDMKKTLDDLQADDMSVSGEIHKKGHPRSGIGE